ncbi:MAG TPA: peptidoglycan DD-metalloendopeptidase family protein, partial [Baekduia sp.]|nr:peptidoglycan DD-metalloendopeptidase family protein [Baekduia sp.]
AGLVGSLSGLTQGHFPVHAKATYADDLSEADTTRKIAKGRNAAIPVDAKAGRKGVDIFARSGAPVIAVQDGKIIKIGRTRRLGRFIQLRDVYGNTYTYGGLKKLARAYAVPKAQKVSRAQIKRELGLDKKDPVPTRPASAGKQVKASAKPAVAVVKERLFANPDRPNARRAGGEQQLLQRTDLSTLAPLSLPRDQVTIKPLKVGSRVVAGTILGRIGRTSARKAPHVRFEIRPAGRGAPRIDPKPVLDGWKLLESTAIYRAQGRNPFFGPDAKTPSVGQILLMSKEALQRRILANPRVEVYDCGRRDIKAGIIDRRVLASLEFLAASGLKPSVTSLRCGHGYFTKGGNVSHHSSGNAVDIAKINGVPVLGNQGQGSVTDLAVRRLLTLQGTIKPAQIITLMTYQGADNTLSLPDHHDHIHVGFTPLYGTDKKTARQLDAVLKPGQWIKLIDRLAQIDNPTVRTTPSKYAITVPKPKRASHAHKGE